jgi:hypothetical protein
MKKVRITTKKGSVGKKFPIFNSPEALYVWLNDPELQALPRLDPSLGSMILLRPGETMEVEWLGCEFYNEGDYVLRIDQVRLAKTMKIRALDKNKILGVHSGWTIEQIISFKNGEDDDTKRSKLSSKSKHKFNIEELFVSRGLIEEQDNEKIKAEDLH